jgi:hypothetical protein
VGTPARLPMEKKMPRLTIDISENKHREINLLRDVGEVSTIKELVNNAFTLLKWAMVERSKGRTICSARREGNEVVLQELEMPILSAAGKHLGFADEVATAPAPAASSHS